MINIDSLFDCEVIIDSRLFCFGLGFSSLALAESLLPKGWNVSGTFRGSDRQDAIKAKNIPTCLFDGSRSTPEISKAISSATDLLITMPPPLLGEHTDEILTNLLEIGGEEVTSLRENGVV